MNGDDTKREVGFIEPEFPRYKDGLSTCIPQSIWLRVRLVSNMNKFMRCEIQLAEISLVDVRKCATAQHPKKIRVGKVNTTAGAVALPDIHWQIING